MLAVEQLTEVI